MQPTSTASASPTATASGATPTATPPSTATATPVPAETAPPSGPVIAVTARPLANGDRFSFAGTTTQSFVYANVSPNPSSTTTYAIVQNVAVAYPKTYAGVANLYDFTTTETDTSPLQAIGTTTDTYYALTAGPTNSQTSLVQQALTTYGSTSTDTNGQALGVTVTAPGFAGTSGTVDLLPEERTPTWTNGAAQTIVQSESDGFTATRTYAADGSYTENATYPQGSAASPAPTPTALDATITENSDGSGTYSLPLVGPPNVTISYAAPANGTIAISIVDPSNNNAVLQSATVGAWFATPLKLYQEIDRDNGAVAFPAACNVSSAYGTQGNQVEQKIVRTDTVLGTLEFFDQLTYVVPTYGAVCVQLQDVTYVFYDYSGQGNGDPTGVSYSGGNAPLETQTVTTTIGITGNPILNGSRRAPDRVGVAARGLVVANARGNFLALVDHRRAQRERRLFARFRSLAARLRR